MTDQNTITNDSGDPKYYILTPQIVLAYCNDTYEFTLWSVIKNIAGELGECFISTEDLAILSMMSSGKCSESRQSLISKGLLDGELRKDPGYPQPVWHLTIPNLWQENTKWREANQSLRVRIELKRNQTEEYKKSLRQVKPSPREGGIPPREGGIPPREGGIPPREAKNNHKGQPKGKTIEATPLHPAITAYRSVAKRYPDKATWPLIESTVGVEQANLDFWEQVVTQYIACGWNKTNVAGMLDFYRQRKIPSTQPINGRNNHNGTSNFGRNNQSGTKPNGRTIPNSCGLGELAIPPAPGEPNPVGA